MPKFMFIYHGGSAPESPEEGEKVMAAWDAWMSGMGDALLDGGNPAGASMTLTASGVTEGGGSNPVSGYTLVQAASMQDAIELGRGCPILNDAQGSIEIAEALDM